MATALQNAITVFDALADFLGVTVDNATKINIVNEYLNIFDENDPMTVEEKADAFLRGIVKHVRNRGRKNAGKHKIAELRAQVDAAIESAASSL